LLDPKGNIWLPSISRPAKGDCPEAERRLEGPWPVDPCLDIEDGSTDRSGGNPAAIASSSMGDCIIDDIMVDTPMPCSTMPTCGTVILKLNRMKIKTPRTIGISG
jgi:hypothetical protein